MIKKLLFFFLGGSLTILCFSSYKNGAFTGGAGNRTGSAGSTANCSTGGCHSANSTNTVCSLTVATLTNVPVSSYTPGETYKVVVGGSNTSALPKFGFQVSAVKASATNVQAGSFTSTSSDVSIVGTTIKLAEHNTPISAVSGFYVASFNWTAPAKGTGTVRFYGILNAVNGTGTTSGDAPNVAPTLDITEGPAAGISGPEKTSFSVFPNPVQDKIHFRIHGIADQNCLIQITDATGRIVTSGKHQIVNGMAVTDLSNLAPGNYFAGIRLGVDVLKVQPFTKN